MKLTNAQIYAYATALADVFQDTTQKLPIKVNFYLQKNKNTLITLAQDIETARGEIIRQYGEPTEDGTQYIISKDKVEEAQRELNDLLSLEQEVNIYTINIDSLNDDITLTTGQMEAIMFMID
jgi:hypothetical protein